MAETLKFYDVKKKRAFTSSNYKIVIRRGANGKRRFAVAKSPLSGIESWRVLGK